MNKPNLKKMSWLDKLCYPLENPKWKQGFKELVTYKENEDGEKIIKAKCAEGMIACVNKINVTYKTYLSRKDFLSLGVPCDLIDECLVWEYLSDNLLLLRKIDAFNMMILCLNDDLKLTPKQIAKFLRTTFEDAV